VQLLGKKDSSRICFLIRIFTCSFPLSSRALPVEKRQRSLTLVLRAPHTSKDAKSSLILLEAACNLVDTLDLGHARLTNTTLAKLRNTRTTLDNEINEEVNKWKKEEEEEARQAAKKKAEQDKFDKLSPAEQEKVRSVMDWLLFRATTLIDTLLSVLYPLQRKQVEKKRQQKKAQGKQMKAR
jgi:hypothetical protein